MLTLSKFCRQNSWEKTYTDNGRNVETIKDETNLTSHGPGCDNAFDVTTRMVSRSLTLSFTYVAW